MPFRSSGFFFAAFVIAYFRFNELPFFAIRGLMSLP